MRITYPAPFRGKPRPQNQNKHRINRDIRAREVRVIDPEGKMIGVMQPKFALRKAEEMNLDLVEIAPNAKPPVCKIIDYGKFTYELQKKEKHQRKQQQQQQMKEIRFKWRIGDHDFNFKTRHAREFLEQGNKVKATVMFRGREIVHKEIGLDVLRRFIEELKDFAKIDQPVKSEGRFLSVILSPATGVAKKT